MNNYIMSSKDNRLLKTNLDFKFNYPLLKGVPQALDRFRELQSIIETASLNDKNKNMVYRLLNECDYILDSIEGYQK